MLKFTIVNVPYKNLNTMLEIRPNCEHCNKDLPYNSEEAMICSFECTYCSNCAIEIFKNVCPSCGGNFQARPMRTKKEILQHPPSTHRIYKKKDVEAHKSMLSMYEDILPKDR